MQFYDLRIKSKKTLKAELSSHVADQSHPDVQEYNQKYSQITLETILLIYLAKMHENWTQTKIGQSRIYETA